MLQVVRLHRIRVGDRSMMSVVEQQHVAAAAGPMSPDSLDERVPIPLMHQDEGCTLEGLVEIERVGIDSLRRQRRIRSVEPLDRGRTCVRDQVGDAPGIERLVDRTSSPRDSSSVAIPRRKCALP